MALPKVKSDATALRLAGLVPGGGAWARAARTHAVARLQAMGLPHRRDEYWRYTDPASLSDVAPIPAAPFPVSDRPEFDDTPRLKITFVDGIFAPDLSDPLAESGLDIIRLSDAAARDIHWAQDLFGQLESAAQTPVERPLAALNTALAQDGVLIRVTGQAARAVNLVYLHRNAQSDAMLHHVIRVEPGASLTLLENGPGAARLNTVTEIDLADGASLHHVRAQGRDPERRAATHSFVRLGTQAQFRSFTLTANGRLTRNECVITLTGDHASAHVAGAALGDGADFHHDDTVFVTHAAVGCESRQVFKKVLRNGATGVFQGKILVKPGAQKTDGYQISQALLLDGDSVFLAKPELEIYADDVKCSHGSTSGAIDQTALFYLRSRGIPEGAAKDLLVLAFLAEALEEIANPALRADMQARLEGWLERHRR